MPQIAIDSIDDPRIAPYRDLPRHKLPRASGLFIAEGRTLVERLLNSDFQVHSVLLDRRYADSTGSRVPPEVPLYITPDGLVEKIVGFNFHRGVMACGRRREDQSLEDTLPAGKGPLTIVVGVGIGDPENLGGLLRNCAALGANAVVLGEGCADPYARRVLRVSMGTALTLPIHEADDLTDALHRLRRQWSCELVATVLDESAEVLCQARGGDRIALLLGCEGHGLAQRWIKLCDRRVTIPMANGADSLNVATASGIFLHHFIRGNRSP